jgi:acetyl esterase
MPPLDPEVAAFLERQKGQPPRSSLDVAATREMMRKAAALAGDPPDLANVEDRIVSGVPAREYVPFEGALPLLVYFHGGRFFSGDLESHDPLCRILAQACACRVLAVDYRMAPEHRFPAALDDACAAVQWAVGQGSPVAIAGDSAGANLAIGAARTVRNPAIRCQVLIYPMINAVCQSASYKEFAEGFGPGAEDMKRGWREYLPEGTDPRDPRVSPIYAADLTGLPPAYLPQRTPHQEEGTS